MRHAYDEHLASNRYYDRNFKLDAAKILPGEYFVSAQGMLLVTVLGSCVAACIRDIEAGLAPNVSVVILTQLADALDVGRSWMAFGT